MYRFAIGYGCAAPSTDELSMPSLIAYCSNGVPFMIDWPTMR